MGKIQIRRQLVLIAVVMLVIMTAYEIFKQLILPDISIWGSHAITIIFTTILATWISYFVLRRFQVEAKKRLDEIESRKQAESSLDDTQLRLAQIIESLPDAAMVVDTNGVVTHWNRAMEQLSKTPKEMMLGKGNYEYALPFYGKRRPIMIDLVRHRDAEIEKKYLNIEERDGVLVYSEAHHPHLGTNGIYLAATAAPFFDADGNCVGAIEVLRDISKQKAYELERDGLIAELQEALASVKTLTGLLPICAKCKKIKDDKGYWKRTESYIETHSDAQFTHGLCNDCKDDLYGDQEWYQRRKRLKITNDA
jgi:PAS domain S-box-containing protein